MEVFRELALMTDAEAEICLQGVMKGYAAVDPEFEALAPQPAQLREVLRSIADAVGGSGSAMSEPSPAERPRAVRMVLVEMASEPKLRPRIEAWIGGSRDTLIEPITSALVLAGIVLVLSTSVDFKYETKDGKKHFKIEIRRKPTTENLLGKFFGLFGGGIAASQGDSGKGGASAGKP